MAAPKKQPQNNLIVTVLVVAAAAAFLLFSGSAPEFLRGYIPQELHSIFYPEQGGGEPGEATGVKMSGLPQTEGNSTIATFDRSKRELKKLYVNARHFTEFYCGSAFDEDFNLDHRRSGFRFRKNEERANRVEWEHIVAAESFGQSFAEWRDGHPKCVKKNGEQFKGRECASKTSKLFQLMEADMYNLVPAIGEVNGDRSNYRFDMIPGEKREYGKCNMEIEDRIAEPPDDKFGDIARTYMYMEAAYGRGVIAQSNIKLFEAWNKMDPVDKWECERARLVEKVQGNKNTILDKACKQAGL